MSRYLQEKIADTLKAPGMAPYRLGGASLGAALGGAAGGWMADRKLRREHEESQEDLDKGEEPEEYERDWGEIMAHQRTAGGAVLGAITGMALLGALGKYRRYQHFQDTPRERLEFEQGVRMTPGELMDQGQSIRAEGKYPSFKLEEALKAPYKDEETYRKALERARKHHETSEGPWEFRADLSPDILGREYILDVAEPSGLVEGMAAGQSQPIQNRVYLNRNLMDAPGLNFDKNPFLVAHEGFHGLQLDTGGEDTSYPRKKVRNMGSIAEILWKRMKRAQEYGRDIPEQYRGAAAYFLDPTEMEAYMQSLSPILENAGIPLEGRAAEDLAEALIKVGEESSMRYNGIRLRGLDLPDYMKPVEDDVKEWVEEGNHALMLWLMGQLKGDRKEKIREEVKDMLPGLVFKDRLRTLDGALRKLTA